MPTVPPTPSKQPAAPNTPAATRKHWSEAFKEQRKQQVRISRSRAWRTLARTRQQAFLFLIRNLWIVPLLVVFLVVCCLLASHSLPGLQPDPVTSIKLHQDPPPADSHLKVTLIPPLNTWEIHGANSPPQALNFELENDGDQQGDFHASFFSSSSGCVHMQPQKEVSSIPAHTAVPFTLTVAAGSCPMPLEVAFSFLYTWTLEKIAPQKPHRLSNAKNTTPDSLQIRTSPPTGSNPAELNFAIQIPPRSHYSRAVPGLPDRHYTGSITTEPILVTSAWAAFVQRLLALASSLASKFTWPILIAFLTIVGQNALARRGERQQIRNNRLDALTSLMQQHYLPITRRMETVTIESQKLPPLRRNLQEALNAPTPDPALTQAAAEAFTFQSRRIFAAILLMRKRILCLIESKGGVFFPSPLAEEIFTGGYSYFYDQFKTSIKDSDHCETLAASLGINTLLHQAHARLFPSRRPINLKTQHALDNFLLWIQDTGTDDDFDRYVVFLDLCEAVMLFEFDRVQYETHAPVFQHNFLDPPPFKFTGTLDKLPPLDGLPDSDPEAERPRFLAKCARYFEGIPEECRPNLLYPGRSS